MAVIANTMLTTERKTRQRLESRVRLDGTYDDPDDVDPTTGKARSKLFIPNNIRKQTMPLNCSDSIMKDSRCPVMRSAITITLQQARIAHEEWKQKMASFARDIADSEIKARTHIQFCEYCDAHTDLAQGFMEVAKRNLLSSPTSLSDHEAVHAAVKAAMEDHEADHWKSLRFVASADTEILGRFYKAYQERVCINYDAQIAPKIEALATNFDEARDHPDYAFVAIVRDLLKEAIPKLTSELWKFDVEQEADRKLDAKLKQLYATKRIAKANEDLGDAMDTDGGANMKSFVSKEVNKEVDRRITNNKKAARKNYSDGSKSQESTSIANGRRSKSVSKKREPKSRAQSTKRQSGDDGNSNSNRRHRQNNDHHNNSNQQYNNSNQYNNNRNNNQPNNQYRASTGDSYNYNNPRGYNNEGYNNNYNNSERGRSRAQTPSILRRRSISWGRSTTPPPPRSRYSNQDHPYRSRGTTYRENQQDGRGRGRGGRGGRGGRSNGRGGRGGRKN